MKHLLATLAISLFASAAAAAPASQASVEELLALTRAESMIDAMYPQIEQVMRQSMKTAQGDKPISAEQQRVVDIMSAKFVAIMREEFNWEKFKPQFTQIYQETFEQEEIDGLIAFYKSPAGQASVVKMPTVMQKAMVLSQEQMKVIYPKMQAAIKQAVSEAKAVK